MKSSSRIYKKTRYPKKIIKLLCYLESCSRHLDDLLESYRYLQPEGGPLSSENIEKFLKFISWKNKWQNIAMKLLGIKECLSAFNMKKNVLRKG